MDTVPVERLAIIYQNCPNNITSQKDREQRSVRRSAGGLHRKAAGSSPQPLGHHSRIAEDELVLATIAVLDADAVVGVHAARALPNLVALLQTARQQPVVGTKKEDPLVLGQSHAKIESMGHSEPPVRTPGSHRHHPCGVQARSQIRHIGDNEDLVW